MKCKKCDKEFEPIKGLINYCSLECRNSRTQTEEANNKRRNKIKSSNEITEFVYCDFECGKVARYVLSSGKFCCNDSTSKCQTIKNKNSENLKLAYKEGTRKSAFLNVSKEDAKNWRDKGIKNRIKNLKSQPFESWGRLLKKQLLLVEQENKCLWCKNDKWNGIAIVLEVDHINGDKSNETRENLRLLCPNCHAQTDTYKIKNKK